MKILVLNSGSSSQKSALYEVQDAIPKHPLQPIWKGTIEWDGAQGKLKSSDSHGTIRKTQIHVSSRKQAVEAMLDSISNGERGAISSLSEINVVGHRIVHGGRDYQRPTIITPEVQETLRRLAIFAPLHNRAELEGIQIVQKRLGPLPQVGVFDTAFHSQMPEPAFVYPGPHEWLAQGIRRYGFHGINHQYCAERAAQLLNRELSSLRIVTCHLGSGCSLAAIQNGHSIDTTMGFTPLEGLMMGTRSGSVDPGILIYLMRQKRHNPEELDQLLNTKSGLLGISGTSGDMREIESAMKQRHERARLAFDVFLHYLCRGIGAMVAVLGGIDVLVFTAGIGENSAAVRTSACKSLRYLGLRLDARKNLSSTEDRQISTTDSQVRALVIHAQEEWTIARECWRLLSASYGNRASATVS